MAGLGGGGFGGQGGFGGLQQQPWERTRTPNIPGATMGNPTARPDFIGQGPFNQMAFQNTPFGGGMPPQMGMGQQPMAQPTGGYGGNPFTAPGSMQSGGLPPQMDTGGKMAMGLVPSSLHPFMTRGVLGGMFR